MNATLSTAASEIRELSMDEVERVAGGAEIMIGENGIAVGASAADAGGVALISGIGRAFKSVINFPIKMI